MVHPFASNFQCVKNCTNVSDFVYMQEGLYILLLFLFYT